MPHGARHGRWDDPGYVIPCGHAVQKSCFRIVWGTNASSMKDGVHTGHPAVRYTPYCSLYLLKPMVGQCAPASCRCETSRNVTCFHARWPLRATLHMSSTFESHLHDALPDHARNMTDPCYQDSCRLRLAIQNRTRIVPLNSHVGLHPLIA